MHGHCIGHALFGHFCKGRPECVKPCDLSGGASHVVAGAVLIKHLCIQCLHAFMLLNWRSSMSWLEGINCVSSEPGG